MNEDSRKNIIILGIAVMLFAFYVVVGLALQKQVWIGINPYIFIGAAIVFGCTLFGQTEPWKQAARIVMIGAMLASFGYMVTTSILYPSNNKYIVYMESCEYKGESPYGLFANKKAYKFDVVAVGGEQVSVETLDSTLYINLATKCTEKRTAEAVEYGIVYQPYKDTNRILEIKEIIK